MASSRRRTRLAPSPTGALHLGNARTFLANYLLARQNQWQIVLRIEDLDGPRIKAGADLQAIEDLRWLGISWDEGPHYQAPRMTRYQKAVDELLSRGIAYPCICTRREVESAASAPHPEDGSTVYPGTCRDRFSSLEAARQMAGREPAIRFRVPDEPFSFVDEFAGEQRCALAQVLGDFVIQKSDGTTAYQLAVVVDDAEAEITDIVRGDDLLDSVPRQVLLYRAMGWEERIPLYTHLPLVVGTDGRRLAKRHGDTRLSFYREMGTSPSRILSLLARWLNIPTSAEPRCADDLVGGFDLRRLSAAQITFTTNDDAFLRGQSK